jgi:hypothetical protein
MYVGGGRNPRESGAWVKISTKLAFGSHLARGHSKAMNYGCLRADSRRRQHYAAMTV